MVSVALDMPIKYASYHAAVNEDAKEQEVARRHALVDAEPPVPYESYCLVKWMTKNLPIRAGNKSVNRQKSGTLPKTDGMSHDGQDDEFEDGCEDDFEDASHRKADLPLPGFPPPCTRRKADVPGLPFPIRPENDWERKQRLKDNQCSNWVHSKAYYPGKGHPESVDGSEDDKESGREEGMATPRVIAFVGDANSGAAQFAKRAFEDERVEASCNLDCKAWIQLGPEYSRNQGRLLQDMLGKLGPPVGQMDAMEQCNDGQLVQKLHLQLKGKKFLIVLEDVMDILLWDDLKSAFPDGNCSPGSALLVITRSVEVANSFSPYKVYDKLKVDSEQRGYLANFYCGQALDICNKINHPDSFSDFGVPPPPYRNEKVPYFNAILRDMALQTNNCRLFLAALYGNPNQTKENFLSLKNSLQNYSSSKNKKLVLKFAYNGLSSNCKNCLLYLSIFPEHTTFGRARLVRRWVADGMITKRVGMNSLEEGDRCLELLVAHRFVTPIETDVTGKIKRFKMENSAHDLITEIATNENFFKTNLPPELACRLPIRNEVQQQQITQMLHPTRSKACWNIFNHLGRNRQNEIDESNATIIFLESLPSSTHLGQLQLLDLEDCKELTNHHLKNICNRVFQLKYLGLRSTEITELPKEIDKLHYLETLDIRQTKVRVFAKNSARLPNLKHLLAGHNNDCKSQDSCQSEQQFLTLQIPKYVGAMTELQVLSRVAVSGSGDALNDIGSLFQLRKLGLVLSGCQRPIFRHLYHAIGNLSRSLRTLSIHIIANDEDPDVDTGTEEALHMPPMHLQKLKISGFANGLPPWVKFLRELTKITLHKSFLTADHIDILGELTSLCYLRLLQETCSERTLINFSKDAFHCLKFLVIECSNITKINFADEAAPKLKKIVWSSTGQWPVSISGIQHLQSLKELKFSGNFVNLEMVQRAIEAHKNKPMLHTNSNDA